MSKLVESHSPNLFKLYVEFASDRECTFNIHPESSVTSVHINTVRVEKLNARRCWKCGTQKLRAIRRNETPSIYI